MSQMLGCGPDGESKTVGCDYDGNLYTVSAPPASFSVMIPSGQSLSNSVNLGGRSLGAIIMPAAWDAASMTFQASLDGVTWFNLLDDSAAEVTLTVAANDFLRLTLSDWLALRYLKLRSGTSGSPVNQSADRIISLVAVAAN